jgi:bacillithiol biosynthesis deacetylase BshB1
MEMKLNVLAFAAHPDDSELGCSGTLARMISLGHKVGVIDLTRGELGTRGSVELRAAEAQAASNLLGLHWRENLGLKDGFVGNTEPERLAIIRAIRAHQPEVLLINAPKDRHPDHGNASILVNEAAFLAGLGKIATVGNDGKPQAPWRPSKVWRYIQDQFLMPDFVVDITDFFELKMKAIEAFSSQFYNPSSGEPETYISSKNFMETVMARSKEMGHMVGVRYGEGFISERPLRVDDLMAHL